MARKPMFLAILLALTATVNASVQATLKLGDPAPKLQIGNWVRGVPIEKFEPGTVYIVEFWATWCGPCIAAIPHLNNLAHKYNNRGLVVIGQNCWERNEKDVAPFVKKMGDKMSYRVATDLKTSRDDHGRMAAAWLNAAERTGIPATFVVNQKGVIAWIGHPMSLTEPLVDSILAGTYDLAKAIDEDLSRRKSEPRNVVLQRQMTVAMQKSDWKDAEVALNELVTLVPKPEDRLGLEVVRFRIQAGKRDFAAAYQTARAVSDANPTNSLLPQVFAHAIMRIKSADKPDLILAELLAKRALELTHGVNPGPYDTMALVQFLKGNQQRAIELQEKAVSLAEARLKGRYEPALNSYRAGKRPGESD